MATVDMMAMGMVRAGWATSSARWVAQSRQAKAQLVLMRPTMNAEIRGGGVSAVKRIVWRVEGLPMPLEDQPVLLTKFAKTNLAD